MLYRIGDIAKLLGISQEALRKFERRGMIQPIKDDENGYRYYHTLDITSLIRCRAYHQYGFSMNEIADLMNTKDISYIVEKYQEREDALEREIYWKTQMLRYLKDMRCLTETMEADYQKCRVEVCPPFYCFDYMRNDELILTDSEREHFANWMKRVPFSALSIRWSKDFALLGVTDFAASLCVPAEYAKSLDYYLGEPVRYMPARTCVYTLSTEDNNQFNVRKSLGYAFEYCREQGLKPVDDAYCRTFLSCDKGGNYTRFRQTWIPVEIA